MLQYPREKKAPHPLPPSRGRDAALWTSGQGRVLPSVHTCLAAGHSTVQELSLTFVRWGLQLFLALACAICPFPEHPCRICVLAG